MRKPKLQSRIHTERLSIDFHVLSPDGQHIRLTIKKLGDFTNRIPQLRPGTRVIIDGPHGVFTAQRCTLPKAILIAGGIGITPLRSLAEELLASGHNVVLIYGNRNDESITFRAEFDALVAASSGHLQIVHVMSNDPTWQGEKGTIDSALILRHVPDLPACDVYL